MRLRNLFFISFAAAALFTACDEKNSENQTPSITLSETSIEFDEAASNKTITVTSTRDWVATVPAGWLTVTPASGSANETYTVTVSVEENTKTDRTAEISFDASIVSETLTVSQSGSAGPAGPTEPTTYAEIYNAATGTAVEAEGTVVGIYNAGMVISKDNDNILVYNKSSNFLPPEVKIGDNVKVSGTKGAYGDLAQIAYYTRMPHYPGVWKKGALQYVPTTIREMGHPTVIRGGDEVIFIINSDLSLYKPLK